MKRYLSLIVVALLCFNAVFSQAKDVDVTWLTGGEISSQYYDSPETEKVDNLIDKNVNTKFLTFNPTVWVVYKAPAPYVVTSYGIASANDAQDRDPKKWTLEGSNNGVSWFQLDERDNISFETRKLTRTFTIANNTTAYLYYRLNILSVRLGNTLQFAEWRLLGKVGEISKDVFADFSVDSYFETSVPIAFVNASLNAVSYSWTFEGGRPATSTDENPSVVYNTQGTYEVTLTASDGTNTSTKSQTIKIVKYQDWSVFTPPTVTLESVNPNNPGYIKYMQLMQAKGYATIEEFVQKCCLTIAKELYYTPQEANLVGLKKISYKFNEGGSLSYKAGSPPNIEIGFDMNYLDNFSKSHSDIASADEIYGVLCHEICHGYQGGPRNAGGYKGGTEEFGFIEGSADMARLLTGGFNPRRYPSPGGSWLDGYNTTAFFYQWITNKYSVTFLKDLNKTTKTINPWTLDAALKSLFNKSAQGMWNEYQGHLTGNSAVNSVEKKSEIIIKLNSDKYLEISNLTIFDDIQIYTLVGRSVYCGKAKGETAIIDVAPLINGIYLVNVSNNTHTSSLKFIK